MLSGSPAERLLAPIADYVKAKGGRIHVRSGCKCAAPPPPPSPALFLLASCLFVLFLRSFSDRRR